MQDPPNAIEVNIRSLVNIQGTDRFGNIAMQASVASSLDAVLFDPTGPSAEVSEISAGSAALSILAPNLGTYNVSVTLGGVHLRGSPFDVDVITKLTPQLSNTLVWGNLVTGEH